MCIFRLIFLSYFYLLLKDHFNDHPTTLENFHDLPQQYKDIKHTLKITF